MGIVRSFPDLLEKRGILLADGAMGSNLFGMGLQTGDCPELWNDEHPDRIAGLHQRFIDAGADIILTNTFGGTRYRLNLHNAGHRVEELNRKGAGIARKQAEEAGREVMVGGSVGPTGEILEPLGSLSIGAAADAFEEQAQALMQGGVDVIWIETMSSREEATAAVIGASRTGLEVVVTFSVDTNGRTMMGLAPADIVQLVLELENATFAIGANCGVGAADTVAAVVNMRTAMNERQLETRVIAKANCGVPEYIDGEIVYSGTKKTMADYVRLCVDAGADIIGGCCGTTPGHVQAMRLALDSHARQAPPDLAAIEHRLGEVSAGAKAQYRGDLSIAGGAVRSRGERRSRRRPRR